MMLIRIRLSTYRKGERSQIELGGVFALLKEKREPRRSYLGGSGALASSGKFEHRGLF